MKKVEKFFFDFSHFFDSMCKINVLNCHKTGLFELKGLFLTQNGKIIFYVSTHVDDFDANNWPFLTKKPLDKLFFWLI